MTCRDSPEDIDKAQDAAAGPVGSGSGEPARVVIAEFASHARVEQMVRRLERNGFPLDRLTIIGAGYHSEERPIGYYRMRDRMRTWGTSGLIWGGVWGLLFGALFFWAPLMQPASLLQPFAQLLLDGVEGALLLGVLAALCAALLSLLLPRRKVLRFASEIRADCFQLVVQGTPQEVGRARSLLQDAPSDRVPGSD